MTICQVMELRKDTTGLYFEFIEYFLTSVVGKNCYKMYRCEKLLSEFTTVSDEALAILILENNIETWKDMVEKILLKIQQLLKNILMVELPKDQLQVHVGIKDGQVMA